MKKTSPKVDAYIADAPEYARPILEKIRSLYHQACPDIEETMKWSFPHFEYRGVVGSMAAFKNHVGFGFWKASLMKDPKGLMSGVGDTSVGRINVASIDELPADKVMLAYIREAVALNENDVKVERPKRDKSASKELVIPEDLQQALNKNKKAKETFEAFSYSHKKEYVEWITEAKQLATREKRLATTIEWLTEGKSRHWKYQC